MLSLMPRKHPPRLLAAFVGLCYLVLSLILPFQHHHPDAAAQQLSSVSHSSATAQAKIPLRTHLIAKNASADHCTACEWQAMNVSTALPAFTTAFVVPSSPRIVTALPRALRSWSPPTHARGPPLA